MQLTRWPAGDKKTEKRLRKGWEFSLNSCSKHSSVSLATSEKSVTHRRDVARIIVPSTMFEVAKYLPASCSVCFQCSAAARLHQSTFFSFHVSPSAFVSVMLTTSGVFMTRPPLSAESRQSPAICTPIIQCDLLDFHGLKQNAALFPCKHHLQQNECGSSNFPQWTVTAGIWFQGHDKSPFLSSLSKKKKKKLI